VLHAANSSATGAKRSMRVCFISSQT